MQQVEHIPWTTGTLQSQPAHQPRPQMHMQGDAHWASIVEEIEIKIFQEVLGAKIGM